MKVIYWFLGALWLNVIFLKLKLVVVVSFLEAGGLVAL
jgi:hypothetical protein